MKRKSATREQISLLRKAVIRNQSLVNLNDPLVLAHLAALRKDIKILQAELQALTKQMAKQKMLLAVRQHRHIPAGNRKKASVA